MFGGVIFRPPVVLGASGNGRIAYGGVDAQSDMQIYTMNADGSDSQQLTNNTNENSTPVWSPDGSKITFMRQDFSDLTQQLFIMNADGSNPIGITNDDSTQSGTPAWSPDGSKIAYARVTSDYSAPSAIVVMNADGSNKTVLTDGSSEDFYPTWSPDGNKIGFVCTDAQHIEQICIMNTNGSNQQQITSGTAIDYKSLTYSPSGTEFAYTAYETISNDIISIQKLGVMNTDGSNQHIITTADSTYVSDAGWSPDGTKLIYDSYDSSENIQRAYLINADGTNETALSPDNQFALAPSWQPIPTGDVDGDGIINTIEAGAPNNGDANGDSVADKFQSNITSIIDPVTGKYVSVQSSCAANTAVSAQALPINYADQGFNYPAGLVGFTLDCGTIGTTATVTQYFYGVPTVDTMVLRKYSSASHTYTTVPDTTVTAITVGGQAVTRITYQITDGGPLDQDGSVNGTIIDPVGLGLPSVGTPNTGVGGTVSFPRILAAPLL
jgi:Tol biopolymer transport system component